MKKLKTYNRILSLLSLAILGLAAGPVQAALQSSANYAIKDVLGSAGRSGASASYNSVATLGQSTPLETAGASASSNYTNYPGFWRAGAGGSVIPTTPGAPTGVTATAGNASATISFTAPASNGGSAITGYTVTSSPGGITGSGSASPITVSGLTNGTAYTFTVTATNAVGTGPASAASNTVLAGGAGLLGGGMQGNPLNHTSSNAIVSTLAGSGTTGSTDATGTAASFYGPYCITTDGTNLYVGELYNHKIRKIVIATGVVSTLAGSGAAGAADSTGTAASFNVPSGITTDGTNLYVSDYSNHKIRKIVVSTGVVTTLAGTGAADSTDGVGVSANFNLPSGITTDGINLYVADQSNNKIRKINIDATVPVTTASLADGTYSAAQTVALSCVDTDGVGCNATYYTTSGATPTTSSSVYANPIIISSTTTLKYFSTDIAGNIESVKTSTYTIDTIFPTLTAPPDINFLVGAGVTSATINIGTATATDNSGSVTVTNSKNVANGGSASFNLGTTTVIWTAVDAAGNTATANQTVTVFRAPGGSSVAVFNVPGTTAGGDGGSSTSETTGRSVTIVSLTASPPPTLVLTNAALSSYQLRVQATFSNGASVDVTKFASIMSMNPAVTRVDSGGKLVGVSPGTATIIVTYEGRTEMLYVTVADDLNSDDKKPPVNTSRNFIKSVSRERSVDLSLSARDNVGVAWYHASESMAIPGAADQWSPTGVETRAFKAEVPFNLSKDSGKKTVTVWFRDTAGNVSEGRSDVIILSPTGEKSPVITEISPIVGKKGDLITIRGESFAGTREGNKVDFNGKAAKVVFADKRGSRLKVQVPEGATGGFITIQAGGKKATSVEKFIVQP